MAKQELLSILITFVVGFTAGGYLYLNYFVPLVQPDGIGSQADQDAFEITSQAYGGCRSDCPAFRVSSDGSFRYQFTVEAGAEPMLRSGTLPRSLRRALDREIVPSAISGQTMPAAGIDCPSARDGIDIRYDISIGGASYRLDSCQTTVDFTSDAWQALNEIWTYINDLSQ